MSESDDLLADLTRRANAASSQPSKKETSTSVDDEIEDIEAFLRAHDGDDYVPPPEDPEPKGTSDQKKAKKGGAPIPPHTVPTPRVGEASIKTEKMSADPGSVTVKTETKQQGRQGASVAPTAPLVPKDDPRTKNTKKTTAAKPVEGGGSKGLAALWLLIKIFVYSLPIIIGMWVLGAWIGSWIDKGWLIAIIAFCVYFIPASIIFFVVKKGRYIWWVTGISLVLSALLIGLFPVITAESIARHGHWPASAILDPMGVSQDNFARRGVNWSTSKISGLLDPKAASIAPLHLGSADPLLPTTTPGGTPAAGSPTQPNAVDGSAPAGADPQNAEGVNVP